LEKISGIVKGSARVSSVDLKSAAPLRSGTPSFGRPVAESTQLNTSGLTTAQKAVALHKELAEKRKATEQPLIIQNMADQFFMKNRNEAVATVKDFDFREDVVRNEQDSDLKAGEAIDLDSGPQEWTAPGTYLDVNV